MNRYIAGYVKNSVENKVVIPAFNYDGETWVGVVAEKIIDKHAMFLGKLPTGEYRSFKFAKIA